MNNQFTKGHIPWNKGKHTGYAPWLGKKRSAETIKKIIETKKNRNLVGDKASNWKGGRSSDSFGYILVHSPNHPFKKKTNYVLEHRLVMEKHIGRYLSSKEVVHHINGIRDDNRIENLILFKNNTEHISKSIFGSNHHAAILNEKSVVEIRKKHKNKVKRKELSLEYGVSLSTIKDVVSKKILETHLRIRCSRSSVPSSICNSP